MRSGYHLLLNGHEPMTVLLDTSSQKKHTFKQVHYTPLNSLQLGFQGSLVDCASDLKCTRLNSAISFIALKTLNVNALRKFKNYC